MKIFNLFKKKERFNEIIDDNFIAHYKDNVGYKAMKKVGKFYYSCHMDTNKIGLYPGNKYHIDKFERKGNIHCEKPMDNITCWHVFLDLSAAKYWTNIDSNLIIAKVNFFAPIISWTQYKDSKKFKCIGSTFIQVLGEVIPLDKWNSNLKELENELIKEYVNTYKADMRLGIDSNKRCKILNTFSPDLFDSSVKKCRKLGLIGKNDAYASKDNSAFIVAVADRLSLLERCN